MVDIERPGQTGGSAPPVNIAVICQLPESRWGDYVAGGNGRVWRWSDKFGVGLDQAASGRDS